MKKSVFPMKAAKIVRVATVPPVMIGGLLLLLMLRPCGTMRGAADVIVSVGAFALLPALAYPLSMIVPKWRAGGRPLQRRLAIILTVVGYVCAFAYSMATGCSDKLRMLTVGYAVSVVLLAAINAFTHVHASGHASGSTGPILYASYVYGAAAALPGVILYCAIIWASLKLKRHTLREFLCGTGICFLGFALAVALYG